MIRWQDGFTHVRLLDWNVKNDSFIQMLIHSLKGKEGATFFDSVNERSLLSCIAGFTSFVENVANLFFN